jgi:hypothetical protein
MTPTSQWAALAAALCLTTAACKNGRSSPAPASIAPTLVGAACVFNTAAPAAGDQLILTFSKAVTLVAGRGLDDGDLLLAAGDTLGAVTGTPTQIASNAVFVLLGPGVRLTPGASTLSLRSPANGLGNDVVQDADGRLGVADAAIPVGVSDGAPPTISDVTIARIQPALNGGGPAGGTLQTPSSGFSISLMHADNVGIALARTRIYADRSVVAGGATVVAGANLVPLLAVEASSPSETRYAVAADRVFADGATTLTAIVLDESGLGSPPRTYTFTVRAFDEARQPFETRVNPTQRWFLDFSRDVESFAVALAGAGADVQVINGANGRADFADVLLALGLLSASPLPNVIGNLDSNQVVTQRFEQELLAQLAAYYADAKIVFTLTAPAESFGGAANIDYNAFGHSRMAIAGSAAEAGVLGRAIFDPNNRTQNDNTLTNFSSQRLGVFLHTIVDFGLGQPSVSSFRQTYDQFVGVLGGQAIGNAAGDAGRLAGATNDARRSAIDVAIRDFARFCATVVAHECGHSMGLVQDGAMPTGLYGGDAANFPGSTAGHIRNTALFPSGSTNIMSPALSYETAIDSATAFNRLNLAYLREQVTYGN